MKWDTATVTVTTESGIRILHSIEGAAHATYVVTRRGVLVWVRRSDQRMERRPLEGTRLYGEFLRLRERYG